MSIGRRWVWPCLAALALPACHEAIKAGRGDASVDGGGELLPSDSATDAPALDASPTGAATDSSDGATEAAAGNLCTGVAQVTADLLHACAVKTDGTMWCWGANGYGQLGDGTFEDRATPVPVTALGSDVVEAATGYSFTCAIKRDGTLWCWGDGHVGQLGGGDLPTTPTAIPTQVVALQSTVAEVAAGGEHACARKLDGTLWCWGVGFAGDGSAGGVHATPTMVSALGSAVVGISVSWYHACARLTDGSLWCWGGNESGELGDGTTTARLTPVEVAGLGHLVTQASAGYQDTCATRSDGTLWCWGWRSGTLIPSMVGSLGSDVLAVSAGWGHFCARKRDGTTWCWGANSEGQLGDGSTSNRSTPVQVNAVTGTVNVAVSDGFTCAVVSGGALLCWGGDALGQLGNGATSADSTPRAVASLGTGVAQLTAGYEFFCARKTAGDLACWGIDPASQSNDGSSVYQPSPVEVASLGRPAAQVAGGDGGAVCVLSTAGEIWCWGWISNATGTFDLRTQPFQVAGLPASLVKVAVGWGHACALASDGTLWCWGRNDNGELGDETDAFFRDTPVQVGGLGASVTDVTARGTHTCARTAGGMLWCWGSNGSGELGDGTTDDRATPLPVAALGSTVRQASAGPADHTCAVLDDGTAWCWGRNDNGELGDGTFEQRALPAQVGGLASVVEIAAGDSHTCARTSDGALWCWGSNGAGQLGMGPSGQAAKATNPVRVAGVGANVSEVAVGSGATCARGADGSVWCWGSRYFGLLADGTLGFSPSPVAPLGCR